MRKHHLYHQNISLRTIIGEFVEDALKGNRISKVLMVVLKLLCSRSATRKEGKGGTNILLSEISVSLVCFGQVDFPPSYHSFFSSRFPTFAEENLAIAAEIKTASRKDVGFRHSSGTIRYIAKNVPVNTITKL